VRVAGNGMGLLNGQTTVRNSILSVEGGRGLFTEKGFRIGHGIAKWSWVMS
jgi:hypothetical protein